MRPLFTVHAGEFLVGEYIERNFPLLNVWIPAKDTGVDLLVTDVNARRTVSLQVKLSRDYRSPEATDELDRSLVAAGWLTLAHEKIKKSPAEWWVIVLVSHERSSKPQFIVLPPSELLSRLVQIHCEAKKYHFYATIPVMLILTIMRQYKAFAGDKGWTLGVAGATVLFAVYARLVAVATVQQFASMIRPL